LRSFTIMSTRYRRRSMYGRYLGKAYGRTSGFRSRALHRAQ
jgi:hypothetical protein